MKLRFGVPAIIGAVVMLFASWSHFSTLPGQRVLAFSISNAMEGSPADRFLRAKKAGGTMDLVGRDYFFGRGDLVWPTLERKGNVGVIHLDIQRPVTSFANKCEFLRQYVVRIGVEEISGLSDIEIINHDTGDVVRVRIDSIPLTSGTEDAFSNTGREC